MIEYKKIQESLSLKQYISDSAIASLYSVTRYYGLNYAVEQLKTWSDASQDGTTLSNVIKAARESQLEADGYEADLQGLRECQDICILPVLSNQGVNHHVIYWGYDEKLGKYIIGDSLTGKVEEYSELALDMIWESKVLVLIKQTEFTLSNNAESDDYWNWALNYGKSNVKWLVSIVILGVIEAILGVFIIIFFQRLIDQLIYSKESIKPLIYGLILVIVILFRGGLGYFRQLLSLHQVKEFNVQMAERFMDKVLHLPKPFFDSQNTGDISAKLRELFKIQSVISQVISNVMVDIVLIFAAVITIFFYQWQVGLITFLCLLVCVWIVKRLHNRNIRGLQIKVNSYAKLQSTFTDVIHGINTIKPFNRQYLFNKLMRSFFEGYQTTLLFVEKTSIRLTFWLEISGALFLCGVLTLISLSILQASITIGTFFLLAQMLMVIMNGVSRLSMTNTQIQEARILFYRIQEFMKLLPEYDLKRDQQLAEIENFEAIEIDHLTFGFTGQKPLLDQISLTIHKGELVAIVGPTNSGKTILSQILQKNYKIDSGEISVNGLNINAISTVAWRNCIGIVEQEVTILNGTIVDNIVLGDQLDYPALLTQFLKEYGFDTYFEQLPHNIHTLIGNGGIPLSKGQKQLIGLARSLWKKPQLLVLDETLSVFDDQTRHSIINLLIRIKSQMGILLLTNKEDTLKSADRTYRWNKFQ